MIIFCFDFGVELHVLKIAKMPGHQREAPVYGGELLASLVLFVLLPLEFHVHRPCAFVFSLTIFPN